MLVSDQGVQSTGCSDDDMWVSILVLQELGILLNRSSTVEDCGLDFGHILAEASIFVLDLVSQLAGVAHNKDGCLASDWVDLLESG